MNEEDVKINLGRIGATVGLLAGVAGLLGAWFILPYRMAAAESKISELQIEVKATREILIRIDENVKQLRKRD